MPVTLVTGPVRSGKSRYVTALAGRSGLPVCVVATAAREACDAQWDARLERHRADRPADWQTIESASLEHGDLLAIFRDAVEQRCIVVDALGTWIGARIAASVNEFERDVTAFEAQLDTQAEAFVASMLASRAHVIVVAEEVGWDVVPIAPSARVFRDVLGRMKQRLAAHAAAVFLVVCGYALDVRALGILVE
jgi:adenosylcobinamide kinase/adenosylcobinamide-phosphate guanylyltransferase